MNIGYAKIKKTGEYVDLEEAIGAELTEGNSYQIQVQGRVLLCESENKPSIGGFYYDSLKPFTYVKGKGKLWVYSQSEESNINIGD